MGIDDFKPIYEDDGDQGGTPPSKEFDAEIGLFLSNFQTLVCALVNEKDTERLTGVQSCVKEVLRQAAVCLSKNKKMKVLDPKDN